MKYIINDKIPRGNAVTVMNNNKLTIGTNINDAIPPKTIGSGCLTNKSSLLIKNFLNKEYKTIPSTNDATMDIIVPKPTKAFNSFSLVEFSILVH